MNAELLFAYAVNQTDYFIIISCKTWINHLIKLDFTEAHLINVEATVLILQSEKNELFKNLIFFNMNLTQAEIVLSNRIIIYRKQKTVNQFQHLINQFSHLWNNYRNFVNVSENKWMRILLRSDVKLQTSAKMYLISSKNHEIVNKTFDKLHN